MRYIKGLGIFSLAALGFIHSSDITAQQTAITTAVPFLAINPDARTGSMGDLGVATEADAASMQWNVGKLAFAQKDMGFNISYTPWLRQLVPDINLAYLGFYKKIGDRVAIGASLKYFSLGDITFTDVNGSNIGIYTPNEFSLDAGASLKLSEYWSGGIAFRFIYSNLTLGQSVNGQATNEGLAGSGDFGFFYQNADKKLFKRPVTWRFGFAFTNIGSKIKYSDVDPDGDFIPTNLRFGASSTLQIDKYNKITWAMEFSKLLVPSVNNSLDDTSTTTNEAQQQSPIVALFTSFGDNRDGFYGEVLEFTYSTGFEYWYNNLFRASVGFFYEPQYSGNRTYFTMGAGVRYKVFGLDFSYLLPVRQNHPLANTLRFSLTFDFDPVKKKKKKDTGVTTSSISKGYTGMSF